MINIEIEQELLIEIHFSSNNLHYSFFYSLNKELDASDILHSDLYLKIRTELFDELDVELYAELESELVVELLNEVTDEIKENSKK